MTAAAGEALQAFGSASVYLEHYVEGGRHVEVQLLGDAHGAIVALGERDCSIQRRHQKLVEEAPAPGLTPDARRRIHELAVRVARSVGLRNAATAEFLVTPAGEAYFLEVNARLQVEHGVTELVSGIDLVHEQLWIAAGQPLSERVRAASAAMADPARHAIELRISAEDPAHAFAPRPGRIGRWREPAGPGCASTPGWRRGRSSAATTTRCCPRSWSSRRTAMGRSAGPAARVAEMETGGIQTTLPFHAWLLRHPAFVAGDVRTDLVDRDWDPAPLREAAARVAIDAVAAHLGADGAIGSAPGGGALRCRGRARCGTPADERRRLDPDGTPGSDRAMAVTDDALLRLTAQGVDADLVVDSLPAAQHRWRSAPAAPAAAPHRRGPDGRAHRFEVTVDGWVIVVTAESAARAALRERATRLASAAGHAGPLTIKAKIPGRVARVWVAVGASVQQGERLLSIEAMKMENEIRAPHAGYRDVPRGRGRATVSNWAAISPSSDDDGHPARAVTRTGGPR